MNRLSVSHVIYTIASDNGIPFRTNPDEQINLVRDLKWYNLGALDGIEAEIREIYANSNEIDA